MLSYPIPAPVSTTENKNSKVELLSPSARDSALGVSKTPRRSHDSRILWPVLVSFSSSSSCMGCTAKVIPPLDVNLMAFDVKLCRICIIRFLSELTTCLRVRSLISMLRVGASRHSFCLGVQSEFVGHAHDRFVCEQTEHATTSLHLTVPGSSLCW